MRGQMRPLRVPLTGSPDAAAPGPTWPATRRGSPPRAGPAGRVIFADQRLRIGPDDLGDAANVAPGVEVATTRRVVIVLDAPDDRFPDAGPLTDLGDGETGLVTRFRQGFTDGHAAPPPLCV